MMRVTHAEWTGRTSDWKREIGVYFWLRLIGALIAAAAFQGGTTDAHAQGVSLPPVNLGDTSFLDGIAFPGFVVQETLSHFRANQFRDADGNDRPGSNRITVNSAVTQLAWISNFRLLGGYYGAEALIPLAEVDADTDFGPNGRERGLGDMSVVPIFIQWPEYKPFGMPFYQRLNLLFKVPTGEYSDRNSVNVGSNLYSFNPYYAFTVLPAQKLEFSSRLYYLWNSKNDDPFYRLGADDAQPGQAFHLNYAASYEIWENLRIGLAGYLLYQFTDDKLDGNDIDKSRERVASLGPGARYKIASWTMTFNSYFETAAENRPEGVKLVFRVSKVF
jgi:hypothetical protein